MLNYKIKKIDNFLNASDFSELSNYARNLSINEDITVYHNEIDEKNNIIESSIDKDLLIKINKNYFSKALEILKELNPEKAKLFCYSDFTIIKTKKNSKFPIHDDTPNKLLSGVVYLYPDHNTGTIFYSNKSGENETKVDWKVNRAVFFSRKERETWHSYEADDANDRITLIFNLMTKEENFKKVLEIEKKNYFISKFRHKINPYLYRFFDYTI